MKNCNCDYDYICSEECELKEKKEMEFHYREYLRYGIVDESGKTIDIREIK